MPDVSCGMAAFAAQARIVHVIGTTGFEEKHEHRIEAAARHATIVKSGNFSLGVNLLAASCAAPPPPWATTGTSRCWRCTTA